MGTGNAVVWCEGAFGMPNGKTAHGLSPDLLRLSVGTEPVEDILATLAEALTGL